MGRKRLYEEFFFYDNAEGTAHCFQCGKELKRKDGSPTGMLRHAKTCNDDVYRAMLAVKNKEYEVEAVVGRRQLNGETQFLVKWLHFGWDVCTWEPAANLVNAEQCIQDFIAAPQYYAAQYLAELLLLQEDQNP
ncbi:Chromodomain proteinY-linked2B [Aphelenchoides avenae]|nr:Chromodomain proteinY-linked2B [Aphelenchus avenae]